MLAHPTHWSFSFAKNGYLYFISEIEGARGEQDIYLACFDGEKYLEPEDLGETINSDGKDLAPFIAPDESYLIYCVNRKDNDADVYISYRMKNNKWSEPKDLGPSINKESCFDLCPRISPGG